MSQFFAKAAKATRPVVKDLAKGFLEDIMGNEKTSGGINNIINSMANTGDGAKTPKVYHTSNSDKPHNNSPISQHNISPLVTQALKDMNTKAKTMKHPGLNSLLSVEDIVEIIDPKWIGGPNKATIRAQVAEHKNPSKSRGVG